MSNDVHTLSGAYALDALSPEEAAEFRRHLEGCQACQDEVRELQAVAARIGDAEAVTPPPELRGRILASADRTPQLPPTTTSIRSTPSPSRTWVAWVGAAAAALVLVTGGILGVRALSHPDTAQLPPTAAAVFDAQDVRTATVETENGGKLTVGVSPSRKEMAVDARDLPELDAGQVYQVWSISAGVPTSRAVLGDTPSGVSMGLPPSNTEVAVTVEPSPGSEAPSEKPIAVVDPSAV